MEYQEFLQNKQKILELIRTAHIQEAVDFAMQVYLSDISELDKADVCTQLADLYDRMGKTGEALDWFDKGIELEQANCHYGVTEKKAEYLSQLGNNNDAVTLYEALIRQSYVREDEKERMRGVIRGLLGKSLGGWR